MDQFCGHEAVTLWLTAAISSRCHGHSICTCEKSTQFPPSALTHYAVSLINPGGLGIDYFLLFATLLIVSRCFENLLCTNGDCRRRVISQPNATCVCQRLCELWVCFFKVPFHIVRSSCCPPFTFHLLIFLVLLSLSSFVRPHLPRFIQPVFSLSPIWLPVAPPIPLTTPHVSPPPTSHNKCIDQHVKPLYHSVWVEVVERRGCTNQDKETTKTWNIKGSTTWWQHNVKTDWSMHLL